MYDPKPIDVSGVALPGGIVELTEKLAENVHAIWARQRLDAGWSHGPERDDRLKRHPNLVAYGELTEEEKSFDRATALGALKTILALGYRIEKI